MFEIVGQSFFEVTKIISDYCEKVLGYPVTAISFAKSSDNPDIRIDYKLSDGKDGQLFISTDEFYKLIFKRRWTFGWDNGKITVGSEVYPVDKQIAGPIILGL